MQNPVSGAHSWAQMVSEPGLADDIGGRFDHILIDEYQDTNQLQAAIVLALKPGGRGLTVVGDDAQSIYSFRAATVRNYLTFLAKFSPPAEDHHTGAQLSLESANPCGCKRRNRSRGRALHQEPVDATRLRRSTATCQRAGRSSPSRLHRGARAGEPRKGGSTLKQQAVLFRTSHHCGPLEVELTRRNIPFVKYGGLKFLDAAHIRDILALLRFVENPRDGIAGFRLMQLIPEIGPVSSQRVLDHMMGAADPIRALLDTPSPTRAADDWGRFVDTLISLRAGRSGWPAELARAPVLWYEPHLERLHEDAITRRADLIQLEQIASGYPSATAVPDGAGARSAGRDQRPVRGAAARRGLSDPFDHQIADDDEASGDADPARSAALVWRAGRPRQ